MEKQLLPGAPAAPPPTAARHRPRAILRRFIPYSIVWLICLYYYNPIFREKSSLHGDGASKLRTYAGESLKWHPCGDITGHALECSTIYAPMDQFNSTNSGDKTFQIPIVRMRGKNATKNLLVNPGGPGVSGISYVYGAGARLNALVGEDFHLVGFDPRGVNSSVPRATCYLDEGSEERLAPGRRTDLIRDSPFLYAWASNFVRGCEENSGEHFKYINTPQTAADMNSIIDALGQEKMMYWGVSYGSLLGQVYATLFPERSERIVLDAVMDQFETFQDIMDKSHFVDNDIVVGGFFDECVRAGAACPLSAFGKTAAELRENVTDVINSLRSRPASVYVNGSVYGVVDDYDAWVNGIFHELYGPAHWPALASRLADLQTGNATSMYLAYVQNSSSDRIPVQNIAVLMNDGRSGPDFWPQSRFSLLEKLLPFFDKYRFAISDMVSYYIKQKWTIPVTHSYVPKRKVETAYPLLVLSTTHDPVCPYATAQEAQRVFVGSRLVSIKGYGHSSHARPSLCAAKYLRNYLIHGSLPEKNVKCETDGPYFPSNDGAKSAVDSGLYTAEEQGIMAAQRAFAEEFSNFL